MDREERLRRAAEDDWGDTGRKIWKPEAELRFSMGWYISHIFMVLYIAAGAGVVLWQAAAGLNYRLLTVATWPWVLSSSKAVLLITLVIFTGVLIRITAEVVKQLRNFPLKPLNLAWFFLYFLVEFAILARFFILMITPEKPEDLVP